MYATATVDTTFFYYPHEYILVNKFIEVFLYTGHINKNV